jgi:uncharacterized membrane protein YeaQ/YmgE (transglycosylase-associated protein family)
VTIAAMITNFASQSPAWIAAIKAMNRLRHGYLEMVLGVRPFISTASHDDIASVHSAFGLRIRPNPVIQLLTTTPAVVSLICAVVVGANVGIVVSQLPGGLVPSVVAGIVGFAVSAIAMQAYSNRAYGNLKEVIETRFPPDA